MSTPDANSPKNISVTAETETASPVAPPAVETISDRIETGERTYNSEYDLGATYDGHEDEEDTFHDAEDTRSSVRNSKATLRIDPDSQASIPQRRVEDPQQVTAAANGEPAAVSETTSDDGPHLNPADKTSLAKHQSALAAEGNISIQPSEAQGQEDGGGEPDSTKEPRTAQSPILKRRDKSSGAPGVSEWSHQRLAVQQESEEEEGEEVEWQAMPALDRYDVFDDDGKLVAKGNKEEDYQAYAGLGGAGKGYTRVQLDEDARSATSLDDDTNYLFKEGSKNTVYEDEEQRDAMAQLQATKDLLTEGQRIAYVGATRLSIYNMIKELGNVEKTKSTKKELVKAAESMEKWGQQMMVRLYGHMDIEAAEQLMIEQLAEHGVQPTDLVRPLMQNSRIKNPLAEANPESKPTSTQSTSEGSVQHSKASMDAQSLPLQDPENKDDVPELQSPDNLPKTDKLDIDIRWTVLCDLLLLLISDSVYDARSRFLLEQVAAAMDVSWVQICRFEKRVIDALEMQEEAAKETWNEDDHIEARRKQGLKRKFMVMGLATVGGGLVIGLSAGLLAPMIGAGLAAGFTTIGVTGTAGFLGGIGGAALITTAATATGGSIAIRASNRRTGHVKTFEYRPLHNNKRLNLILTVSGWMNGKVDDVRLPFSTVDPIMGDIYSLSWEPEMLQSAGDTINILATEALTQTVQQVLGSTILITLMAGLQLPIVLTKLAYLIDNPWTVSLDRANAAGLILADSLIDRHLGQRPITLVGFSLGSRLIFSCLKELASRHAYGLIQNVYLFGSPVVAKKDEWIRARSIISGRFVNGYAVNDWILAYLFRLTSGGVMQVAGLAPLQGVLGLENLDVSKLVNGHMSYRAAMPKLLREVGWEVESDEFTEIEDPDPENHTKRQRELIQEIDDARKKAEEGSLKKRFGIFKRGKQKNWEKYDAEKHGHVRNSSNGESSSSEPNVLFDIEAIRKELKSEMIEVRELDSTLPPMQIRTLPNGEKIEPLPLPPADLTPEELAAMRLPPRPSEIEDEQTPPPTSNGIHRSPSPAKTPATNFDFETPRELKTTLPPLTLSPSTPQDDFQPLSRPGLPQTKSHNYTLTPPTKPTWGTSSPGRGTPSPSRSAGELASPVEAMNLEHNAWADDEVDEFGNRKGEEFKMTFE